VSLPEKSEQMDARISSSLFYRNYDGHKLSHLEELLPQLRQYKGPHQIQTRSDRVHDCVRSSADQPATVSISQRGLLWTAGDSSLDNKYWFNDNVAAVGPYYTALAPPTSKPDVAYWLNYQLMTEQEQELIAPRLQQHNVKAAINTAVEASTLNERTFCLRMQDRFIRDNIQPEDVLVVSVGGNDVALLPLPCTICAIVGLLHCVPESFVEHGISCGYVPIDDCCCGCGSSLCSCFFGFPPCLGYLRHLFGFRMQKYIQSLTAKTKPSVVLVCMIYYPDERENVRSWANPALYVLGYNSNPARLQQLIRKAFTDAVSKIKIEGTVIVPVPLYHVLDGKDTRDYVDRVEPSPTGGRKMAQLILEFLEARASFDTGSTKFPSLPLCYDPQLLQHSLEHQSPSRSTMERG
jgi:hypothetical protein